MVRFPQDYLQKMLDKQVAFAVTLRDRFPERYGVDKLVDLKEEILMAHVELDEVLACLPWKRHKADYGRVVDLDEQAAAIEETIDVLHFVLNILIKLGVTRSDQVWQVFNEKNTVNQNRQRRDGY